VTAFSQKCNV